MLLHGIDTNKVNRLQILLGVTSLVDGETKVLGVSFPGLLMSQKMLSDETCCGWRVGTKCKFFYRRICLACVSVHQLDQRLYSSGDCGRTGLGSVIIWFSRSSQY